MENVDVEELYNCLETNSEESQNADSAAEEDRLKKAEDLLDDLITSIAEDKLTKKSDSASSVQEENKDIQQGVGKPSKSAKTESVNSDVSDAKPSSSGSDSSKSPFQLNDNMKKGLSLLAYPGKVSRPNSKPRNKVVQQPRTKTKCRITIGETIEKVQDIKNSIAEQEKKSETENMAGPQVSQKDLCDNENEGPSVSSGVENSEVSLQSASVEPKSKVGEKENWTGKSPDVLQRTVAMISPTNKAGKPEERIPLATKPRAPPTRFKLSPRMGELLRFTFAHEHFPTSVHMARLAKMMGVQWSQVRNWFTNRRVENKRAGIFPRDKVLTECPYCDVTLKTEAEQKGHLFATHHVKNILGAEFVGDQEPIKWKKFPTSINAINKLSGARVLAIGYSADSEHDSQETLSETLESSTHTPDTLLQTLGSDSEKAKSKKLRKTWQVSMGLQKDEQNATESNSSSAVENKDGSQPSHSENAGKKRSESVVYLKMESGEEKAITTKERDIPVEGSLRVKPDKLLLSSSVSFAPLISVPPPVHPGDPCTSKTNINQEVEHAQAPKTIKLENTIETTENLPSTSKDDKTMEKQGIAKDYQVRSNKEVQLLKSPKPPPMKCEDNQSPTSQKTLQDTDQMHPRATEIQKTFSQRSKTNEILIVPNSSVMASANCLQSVHPVKENAAMKVPEECRITSASTPGLVSVAATNPRAYIESKESLQNVQNYSWNKVDSVRHRFQDNVGDEYMNIGYQCPTCSKVFVTEWQMMKHSLSHFKFQCDICEQSFTSQGGLKQHLYEHLTNTYEDEKYYMQFSCKTCHSLKCECFEPLYFKAEEMLRTYTRPQKAKRSSKVFLSKPNSGPNDHLRVSLGTYRKRLQKMHPSSMPKAASSQVNPDTQRVLLRNLNHPLQKNKFGYHSVENSAEVNCSKLQGNLHNSNNSRNIPHENVNTNQRDIPRLSVRNDLLITPTEESTSGAQILSQASEEKKPKSERRGRGKRTTKLSSSNFIYKDTDFYFMCEMCDASFLSKAELSEHMFFHRLKSRSRRAGKRRLAESEQEEETEAKKFKEEEPLVTEEVETINVGGFERFKCPNCKGHFASITDLNRHRTQAHKGNETIPSTPECISVPCIMLQCYFCNRFYRRERELRRHLKHDCTAAPEDLKNKLSVGVSLTSLQEMGEGPYFVKTERNTVESVSPDLNSKLSSHRGPITCKYCFMVTRREAEMKRHVWKYCPKIPKSVIKIFKEGASLEELGFVYGEVTVEPVSSQTLNNKSKVLPTTENMDVDIEIGAGNSSPSKAPQTPAVPVINPMPLATSSRSKGPLICTYCGIWYFREISLLKHMKERCIRISQEDKNLLHLGSGLCTFTPDTPLDTCGPAEKQGIYKIVDRSRVPVTPIKTETSESRAVVPAPQQADSLALPAVKEEPDEASAQGGVTPTKQGVTPTKQGVTPTKQGVTPTKQGVTPCKQGVTPIKQGMTTTNQGVIPTKQGEFQAHVSSPDSSPIMKGSGRKSTRCRRCHESFSSQDAIMAHSSVHHGPKKGFYKCKLCQVKFVKYKHLREHVWEHTNETPYKCHMCATKFRTSDSIMDHLYTEHKFTQINEKNLYKWLPGRTGKYREIKEVTKNTNCEGTLTDMDASLENLAEVMVVTDQDIWKGKNNEKSPLKTIEDKNLKAPIIGQSVKTSPSIQKGEMAGKPGIQVTPIAGSSSLNDKKVDPETKQTSDIIIKTVNKEGKSQDIICVESKKEVTKGEQVNVSIARSAENNQVKIVKRQVKKKSNAVGAENMKGTKDIMSIRNSSNCAKIDDSKSVSVTTSNSELSVPGKSDSNTSMTEVRPENESCGELEEGNGEEFLSCLENLESVIETVELTDNCLS